MSRLNRGERTGREGGARVIASTDAASTTETKSVRAADRRGGGLSARQRDIRATTVSEVAEAAGVSRGWLYRHYPTRRPCWGRPSCGSTRAFWGESAGPCRRSADSRNNWRSGCDWAAAPRDARRAGQIRLRRDEPEEFAACAGAGVQGLPDLGRFWKPYLEAARDRGEIHPETELDGAANGWPCADQPRHGSRDTPRSRRSRRGAAPRRYVLPALRATPRNEPQATRASTSSLMGLSARRAPSGCRGSARSAGGRGPR